MYYECKTDSTDLSLHLDIYTPSERREYLVKRGSKCHPTNMRSFNGLDNSETNKEDELGVWYDVLSRYDSLIGAADDINNGVTVDGNLNGGNVSGGPSNKGKSSELERMAIELWKYCVLYNGDGHVYIDYESSLLRPLDSVLTNLEANVGIIAQDSPNYIHTSFMAISPYSPATYELGAMIRLLLETSDEMLSHSPLLLARELHRMIVGRADQTLNSNEEKNAEKEEDDTSATWSLWKNHCMKIGDADESAFASSSVGLSGWGSGTSDVYARKTASSCPLSEGGYCCLAFLEDDPVMALRHPVGGWGLAFTIGLPYSLDPTGKEAVSHGDLKLGGVPEGDLPYISTVRIVQNDTDSSDEASHGTMAAHPADTPNFFDILFENDCLPYRKECHRCLKDVTNEAPAEDEEGNKIAITTTNACNKCKLECPCYCDILCKVRPPPKKVVRSYVVHPPRYKKEVGRLVPKIIHQVRFDFFHGNHYL